MVYIQDLGKIKRITIPDGWKVESNSDDSGDLITYRHPDEKDVKISCFFRGKPLSQLTSESLLRILASPAHSLNLDEHLSIETVLRDAAETEYFDLKTFRSYEISGQMVLLSEGFWKLSDLDSLAAFICSVEEEGIRVDEIYFVAPKEKFDKYLPVFQDTLNSIQWTN